MADEDNFRSSVALMNEEYLKIAEVAARLKVKPKTIKNKMASGIFQKGIHYFKPPSMSPRFKWSAVVKWMEEGQEQTTRDEDSIPMARGYQLRSPGPQEKTRQAS